MSFEQSGWTGRETQVFPSFAGVAKPRLRKRIGRYETLAVVGSFVRAYTRYLDILSKGTEPLAR